MKKDDSIASSEKLYLDPRLGNEPRYILTNKPEALMQIPPEAKKSVVFLGYRNAAGEEHFAGTAFYVSRRIGIGFGFTYLVTAKHVIEGIRKKNVDKVLMRVNLINRKAEWVETDIKDWLSHPTDPTVDVAVKRAALFDWLDHLSFPMISFVTNYEITENEIDIGDEVFLTGLFANHYGRERNIPIVRTGNIAAMPDEKVEIPELGLIDAYLVEARSIGGISGSPVYVYLGLSRVTRHQRQLSSTGAPIYYLLGLMHGHYHKRLSSRADASVEDLPQDEMVNMGIAIVVPATKILEVINQPMIKDADDKDEREWRKNRLPVADSLAEDEGITQDGFEDALRRSSRKISPPDEGEKET